MSDASRSAQVHDGSHCHLSTSCTCMLEKHQHQERLSALDLHRKQSVLPSLPHADLGYAVLIWSKYVWPGGINGSATNISGYSKAMTTRPGLQTLGPPGAGQEKEELGTTGRSWLREPPTHPQPVCSPRESGLPKLFKTGQEPGIYGKCSLLNIIKPTNTCRTKQGM